MSRLSRLKSTPSPTSKSTPTPVPTPDPASTHAHPTPRAPHIIQPYSFRPGEFREAIARLGTHPILTAAEERALAARIQGEDREDARAARDTLVTCNFRLVVTIAKFYVHRGLDGDDILGYGMLGLIRAAEDFQVGIKNSNYKFSTYASYWIKCSILRAIQRHGSAITLPAYLEQHMRDWRRTAAEMAIELDGEPQPEDVDARLGLSAKRAKLIAAGFQAHHAIACAVAVHPVQIGFGPRASIDEPEGPDVAVAEEAGRNELLASLIEVVGSDSPVHILSDRERRVLTLRFGLDKSQHDGKEMTLKEIGQEYGLTRERVRQIQNEAIEKLRRWLLPNGDH